MRKLLVVLFSMIPLLALSAESNVSLESYSDGSKVKLYWNVNEWPEDVEGFNLKRRIKGTKEWMLLNASPIRMAITRSRDWSLLGLNSEQKNQILSFIDEKVKSKRFKEISEDTFLDAVQMQGVPSGARIKFKSDFRTVLLHGFGYIDNNYDSSKVYEYALFGVEAGSREQSSALAKATVKYFKTDAPELKTIITFKVDQRAFKKTVTLEWAKKVIDSKKFGFLGYNVYRKENGDEDWKCLVNYELGARTIDGPYSGNEKYPMNRWNLADGKSLIKRWEYEDDTADPNKSYTYAVAPKNMFQVEFAKSVVKYDPEDFTDLPSAIFNKLKIVEGQNFKISWKMNENALKRVLAYELYSVPPSAADDPKLIVRLPASCNSYIDKSKKKKKKYYKYLLRVIDIYGREYDSQQLGFVYMRWEKPPKVTGLKATYEISERGCANVHITWDKKSPDDKVTDRYHIAEDSFKEGEVMWNSSLWDLRDNKYSFRISGKLRSYTVKVRAVAPQSENCEVSEWSEVKIDVGLLELPRPKVNFFVNRNGFIQCDWEYPNCKEAKGFRIFVREKLILDNINPELRSLELKSFKGSEVDPANFYFRFQAFGENEKLVSDKVGDFVSFGPDRIRHEIPAPKDFKVIKDYSKGGLKLKLNWKDVPTKGLYCYKFKVYTFNFAYAPEGWNMSAGRWPLQDDEFLPGAERIHNWPAEYKEGKFIIELWAVIQHGKQFLDGRRAFVEINLSKQDSIVENKNKNKNKGKKK